MLLIFTPRNLKLKKLFAGPKFPKMSLIIISHQRFQILGRSLWHLLGSVPHYRKGLLRHPIFTLNPVLLQ